MGPDHRKVAPAAFELPLTATEVVPQVRTPAAAAVAVGGVVFCVTDAVAVLLHPVAVLVTITV